MNIQFKTNGYKGGILVLTLKRAAAIFAAFTMLVFFLQFYVDAGA